MTKFRTSVSTAELRAGQPAKEQGRFETVYQASRGGSFPVGPQPVPGAPKDESTVEPTPRG